MRALNLTVVTAFALSASVNLACADVTVDCGVGTAGGQGSEICTINGETPAVTSVPGGTASLPVSFPQFNPRLGTLQQVSLSFSALGAGTATLTYEHDPLDGVYVWGGIPYVSFSNPELFGFFFDGRYYPPTVYGGDLQGWSFDFAPPPTPPELPSSWGIGGVQTSTAPEIHPYIGTGQLTFDVIVGSGFSEVGACYCPVDTITSLGPVQFSDILTYDFTTATVPEPSLLFASGALFGLILALRRRIAR
jgi:hypothetical protein